MMLKRFYIYRDTFIFFIAVMFITLYFFSILTFLSLAFLISIYFLLHRKRIINYKNRVKESNSVLVSPVNGRLVSISTNKILDGFSHNATVLRFRIGFFNEWGVYFPFTAKVESFLQGIGKKFFRFNNVLKPNSHSSSSISIENTNNHKVMIRCFPCVFGLKGNFWVNSGDKGKSNACMGFLPYGGTVEVIIDGENDVLIAEGDKVAAATTVIAGIKE
jgi:hypothetical protein